MKFLEYTPFARINSFLRHIPLSEYTVDGVLEAYSCKVAGIDKKLSRSVEQEVIEALAMSPQDLATSPVGPLSSSASRKTLVYLILTLNHAFPDYDFSMLRAHHFAKEPGLTAVQQTIDQTLADVAKMWVKDEAGDSRSFQGAMWMAIDEVIQLAECEIYSYQPEAEEGNPFADQGTVWSFNYFFYNRKLKRIVFFNCRCRRRGSDNSSSEGEYSDNELVDFADDMDME